MSSQAWRWDPFEDPAEPGRRGTPDPADAFPGPEDAETVELTIEDIDQGTLGDEGFRPVRIITDRGDVEFRLYGGPQDWEMPDVEETMADPTAQKGLGRFDAGVIWAAGAIGGWHSPARGLYDRIIEELADRGLPSLRVRFRDSHDLLESTLDVLTGAAYLESLGLRRLGMVGHSFGGAVVIQAAAQQEAVRTVVALASQSSGAEAAGDLGAGRSLLLLHGLEDRILPPWAAHQINSLSTAKTRLITYPQADHNLDEVAPEVATEVMRWLMTHLAEP